MVNNNTGAIIPDIIKAQISDGSKTPEIHDPSLKRLQQADVLGHDPENSLTELSNDECIDFAILEALHTHDIIRLKGTMEFLKILKRNRVALDRKRTDEYLKSIIGQVQRLPDYGAVGAPGSFEVEEKQSLVQRFVAWFKK